MRPLALLLFAGALFSSAHAQQKFIYPTPPLEQTAVNKDIVYRKAGDRELRMDLYRPAGAAAPLPVIIFLDAFGGQSQRDWVIYTGWARAATAHGFAAINADTHTDGVAEDLDALAAYLREHAVELRVDPDRIAVYAASGNAFRALPIIQDRKRNWIKAAAIYYGSADIQQYRPDIPLLWIRAGLDRPGMNRGIDEQAALALRQNVSVTVVNFAGGHHGFEVIDDNDAARDVIDQTFQFFKKSLSPSWRAGFAAGQRQAEAAGAVMVGDYARAVSIYGQLVGENGNSSVLLLSYGEALLGAKRYREARAQFDRVKQLGGAGPRDLGVPAARASALDGDADAAIAWLKSIPKQFRPKSLEQDAAFEKLHGRADFQELFKN